ncbi:hypothetical protein PENSPDRAFT_582211, partial [Peniophora sp. CONT]
EIRHRTFGMEYELSQAERKREHGFLARKKSLSGRKMLVWRKAKGRKNMSH